MGKRKKSDDGPMAVHLRLSKDEQRLEAFLRWLIAETEAKQKREGAIALDAKPAPKEK